VILSTYQISLARTSQRFGASAMPLNL